MVQAFFHWWGRQLSELAPWRALPGGTPRSALMLDAAGPDPAGCTLVLRQRRAERPLGRFAADAAGIAALRQAESTGRPVGAYSIQAAIAACHATALTVEETDWEHVAELYEVLGDVWPSPVVQLNRAVAVGMAFGAEAGLELVDTLTDARELQNYPMLPAVRADLLRKLGKTADARREYEHAAALTQNESERGILLRRAADCK